MPRIGASVRRRVRRPSLVRRCQLLGTPRVPCGQWPAWFDDGVLVGQVRVFLSLIAMDEHLIATDCD
jgi:hypothetical protein